MQNTSSCDASAESASDSEYSSSGSDHPASSDDPTTVSTSTFLHQTHAALLETSLKNLSSCSSTTNMFGSGTLNYCIGASAALSLSPSSVKSQKSPAVSNSDTGNQTITPFSGASLATGTVPLRSKKRLTYGKQRPKSFTDTLEAIPGNSATGSNVCSPSGSWLRTSPSYFVSDSAINLLGNQRTSSSEGSGCSSTGDCACSPESTNFDSPSHTKKKGSRLKRRSQKGRKKALQNDDTAVADDKNQRGFVRSSSFTGSYMSYSKTHNLH